MRYLLPSEIIEEIIKKIEENIKEESIKKMQIKPPEPKCFWVPGHCGR